MQYISPCPFCDNADIRKTEKYTGNYRYGKPVYIVFMKCSLCEATSKSVSYILDNEKEAMSAELEVLSAWNKRAKHTVTDQEAYWYIEAYGIYGYNAFCSRCHHGFEYDGNPLPVCPNCRSKMNIEPIYIKEIEP